MRKMPNDVEKLDRISQSVDADGEGNVEVGKNLEVDGAIKLSSLNSTFTKGELPVNHAYNSSQGEMVYSSVSQIYAANAGHWILSPLFFKRRPPQYGDFNPRCIYAYKSDNNSQTTISQIALQGTVAITTITIRNSDMSLKACYLNSAYETGNLVYPQTGSIDDYASFVKNLNLNKGLFVSLAGYTKLGAPLSLVYADGKPYVRVVNRTTLEESNILIPEDATFSFQPSELLSK